VKVDFLRIFPVLLIGSFLIGCSANPVTGKKDFAVMSEKREIALGQQSDPSIVAAYGLYEDQKMQSFIERKGQEMARISHRPGLKYDFKVVDSPIVNAFAVPGGFVYFTRGIMAHFNNEAEFAGVLGHEIGHITARHSVKQQRNAIVAQLGMVLGMVFSSQFREFSNLANNGVGLLFLKFGRDAESQSDKLGVEYSSKIGYDAHEMGGFFKTIGRLQQASGAEIPTFLSTHPDPADRFNKVNRMADDFQSKNPGAGTKVNRDSYLRMIDGLLYGEDPKQGYVENNAFYHPELKFSFSLPNNWKTINSPSQFQAVEPSQKAMILLELSGQKNLVDAQAEVLQKYQLQLQNQQDVTVNGLPAKALLGSSTDVRAQIYLIQYNNLIYILTGVTSLADFQGYKLLFSNTQKSFKKLTDQSKINVYPDRIKIVSASSNGSLVSVLNANKVPSKDHKEHAILNGMELNTTIKKGQLIKTIARG